MQKKHKHFQKKENNIKKKKKLKTIYPSDIQIEEAENASESAQNKEEGNSLESIQNIIAELSPYVPFWGGKINYRKKIVDITNTCTIDNLLFSFWVASRIIQSFLERIPSLKKTDIIKRIITEINNKNWNSAKELWIKNIMKYNKKEENKSISLFGSESDQFTKHINEYKNHHLIQLCSPSCNLNRNVIIQENCDKIYFKKIRKNVILYSGFSKTCKNCKKKISCEINFEHDPNFIFVESMNVKILFNELPKVIVIRGISYKLLCSTVHIRNHFLGIFNINDNFFKIDDLDQSFVHLDDKTTNRRNKI